MPKEKKEITLTELLAAKNPEQLVQCIEFESGLQLLEQLILQVESGQLPLKDALCSYERGVQLVQSLRAQLEGVEQRLKVLQLETSGSE